MKTICPPGFHHNDFVATYALGHMSTSSDKVHKLPQNHCGDNR